MVGVAAGALGALLAVWGLGVARSWFRFDRSAMVLEPDMRVLAFAAVLSVSVGVLSALVPALRAARTDSTLYVWLATGAPVSTIPTLQTALRDALGRPVDSFRALDRQLDEWLVGQRLSAAALNLFAAFALLLSAMGVYGSVAHAVARRTQEIGIRLALGARKRNVLALVGRHAALVAGSGVALGLAGSLALARLLGAFVTTMSPTNPWALGTAALLIGAVALVATYVPARRALAVDPATALRSD